MGSPVSVTVANVIMEDVEWRAICTYHSPPPFGKRYMDDITVLPVHLINSFLDNLNKTEESINFTVELGNNYTLAFQIDGSLSTTVYRK